MKKTIFLCLMSAVLLLCACHQDNDDYMTIAKVRLDGGDSMTINRVQAMAHFTNLNIRHVTSTSNFAGPDVQVELLRGAYQVLVEGILDFTDVDGRHYVRPFRAVSDYVELIGTGSSHATINIILLD